MHSLDWPRTSFQRSQAPRKETNFAPLRSTLVQWKQHLSWFDPGTTALDRLRRWRPAQTVPPEAALHSDRSPIGWAVLGTAQHWQPFVQLVPIDFVKTSAPHPLRLEPAPFARSIHWTSCRWIAEFGLTTDPFAGRVVQKQHLTRYSPGQNRQLVRD